MLSWTTNLTSRKCFANNSAAINTLILLSSGAAVTWAHWGLGKGNRGQLKLGLLITIALGVLFLCMQASEYRHAYTALNLNLRTGAYGATFFSAAFAAVSDDPHAAPGSCAAVATSVTPGSCGGLIAGGGSTGGSATATATLAQSAFPSDAPETTSLADAFPAIQTYERVNHESAVRQA